MDGGRGFRGWLAAITVGVTLALVFLVVEKYIRLPGSTLYRATQLEQPHSVEAGRAGILLTTNPSLAGVKEYPRNDTTPIARRSPASVGQHATGLLRRPPEPATGVVLRAPVAFEQLTELPLHGNTSQVDYLMEAMEQALQSPMRAVSAQRALAPAPTPGMPIRPERLAALPSPASIAGRIPEPKSLYAELALLRQLVAPQAAQLPFSTPTYSSLVSQLPYTRLSTSDAQLIDTWAVQTQTLLEQLIVQHGLEHPASVSELGQLAGLADHATEIANGLSDYDMAQRLTSIGFGLERRIAVWQAIQGCLDGTTIALTTPRNPDAAREELAAVIAKVESRLAETGDAETWRTYLLLDKLSAWVASPQDIWVEGNNLALTVLSRLHWQRLSEPQKHFLNQPEFEELASHLLVWGRDPVDYRQLLAELETFEIDPISRINGSLAGAVQILRLSQEEAQQRVAATLNNHYRNANIRLSISQELIQRLLPENQVDVRPVRQRILGAETAGDSAVRTELQVQLVPDETAWNLGIGVKGDMVSSTRSSKGPATFHNTSTAQINSRRYVRLDPMGYHVSAEPTNVNTQDYLRKMSTDFDGLPIIGDLARFLVREQFDQKRGVAQRITRKIIAREADAELDRRLEESMTQAEEELQRRLVGPLEQLNLNPMVVAMNTTAERLTIRYRVANEAQMASHTPRPRAPTDSLLSMQMHQSAINNAIAQIGLSGRTWTLPDLYARLGEVFQQSDWELPEDIPSGITIRFADSRPVTVELVDGKLRLTLRIAELRQADQLLIERFIVSSNYVPLADGLTAELMRDGVVEIECAHSRDRFRLRIIFAKVFVSNPQIPLISESWVTDPRAEGLAVSQVEIRDGWLAVAISKSDSQLAAEVAARAQEMRNLQ